jgi:hypothetical protein
MSCCCCCRRCCCGSRVEQIKTIDEEVGRERSSSFLGQRPKEEEILVSYFFGKFDTYVKPWFSCYSSNELKKQTQFKIYKFGLPGSEGSWWKNYLYYQMNNQEVLAMLFVHRLNTLKRWQRFLIFACGFTTTIFVNSLFIGQTDLGSKIAAIVISIALLQPTQLFLRETALMQVCEKNNCCVKLSHFLGDFLFISVSLGFLAIFLTIACFQLVAQDPAWVDSYIRSVFLSLGLGYAFKLVLELPNWFVLRWEEAFLIGRLPTLRWLLSMALSPIFDETYLESQDRFLSNYAGDAYKAAKTLFIDKNNGGLEQLSAVKLKQFVRVRARITLWTSYSTATASATSALSHPRPLRPRWRLHPWRSTRPRRAMPWVVS